ncbi:MAG: hypothetical protein Q8M31_04195, partial [Beijerinckiaceae bacterium]|nr:hypothetical protein [Beijerinckiaceae bacterium]
AAIPAQMIAFFRPAALDFGMAGPSGITTVNDRPGHFKITICLPARRLARGRKANLKHPITFLSVFGYLRRDAYRCS